jgi:hypothetical protein
MIEQFNKNNQGEDLEINLREVIVKLKNWFTFLKSKWLIILAFGIIGSTLGFINANDQKTFYIATISFVVEGDNSNVGISSAMGLASTLGIDMGSSASGLFSGNNIIELMRSRTLIEKVLLSTIKVKNKTLTFAEYYLEFSGIREKFVNNSILSNIHFNESDEREKFTIQKDSLLGTIYETLINTEGIFKIEQKEKKSSILNVQFKSQNELFSKAFVEGIVAEVSQFYILTKSKKARNNVEILQKQVDSVRNKLNGAISGVAESNDNTFNLNPAYNIKRATTTSKQFDVQANTAILTQLVTNLEMSRMTLLKETPLIQIIDKPIIPLKRTEKKGKLTSLILYGILSSLIGIILLSSYRVVNNLIKANFNGNI